ncbi:MAG: MarR family transcriptional regulator, partial [Rhodospirillales bacterium]|nr:MarR family transcriptional regulator [Rhodospirillales bacterium]
MGRLADSASSLSGPRVADLLERIGRLLRGARRREEDLDPAQWETLRYLGRANRYSRNPTALAEYLGTTKGTTSQTVIALERKGLVSRDPDPADGRAVRLNLTTEGLAVRLRDPLFSGVTGVDRSALGRMEEDLSELLVELQHRNNQKPFGQCRTCRFFRRDDAPSEPGG